MEVETAFGVVGARVSASSGRERKAAGPPETTLRRSDPRGDGAKKISLSAEQRRIAESLGLSAEDLTHQMERRAARLEQRAATSPYGLTAAQRDICRSLGLSERQFAIAAGHAERREEAGLLHAHQEIDRAHEATYDAQHQASPDRELLDSALSELKGYDPNDDSTYNRLLKGVVYAARLLNRVAPAYADQKKID